MRRTGISIGSLTIAGFITLGLGATPIGLSHDFTPEIKSAFAKGGGGGGNGGGHGGGHANTGNGNEFDQDKGTGDGHDKGHGNGHDKGHGHGHDKGHGHGHDKGHVVETAHHGHGSKSSALGNLNAAHASPTARANASPNSMVGLIAAYAAEAQTMTTAEAQEALGAISNKSSYDAELDAEAVDAEVVAEVNEMLGVENLGEEEQAE